ncbi:MAG: hypothetical protein M3415_07970 [Actinomycetota bacterium]|nr:hypothetical protein [Actinomycetota bacterium]
MNDAQRWSQTMTALGVTHDSTAALTDLRRRHDEPQRRYHTIDHVRWVLTSSRWLHESGEAVEDPGALMAAAWFHDAVYQPGATDNEARSASLADAVLARLGVAEDRRRRVVDLVLATVDHVAEAGDAAVLVDADLAILAAAEQAYSAYAAAVRAEYAFLPAPQFDAGRAEFIARMLARRRIFATATARGRWEARARHNLGAELARLQQPSGR